MMLWVLYDIRNDRARSRAAKHCKRAGLHRIQLSVFIGQVSTTERDSLRLDLEDEIDPDHDKVYLFSLRKKELDQAILLGQAFDRKLVKDELITLWL